jgi:two-component system, NarL family, nitrate/nitrite response regulator NarL
MAGQREAMAVALVDEQPIYRVALERLVERAAGFRLVGSFGSGNQALSEIRRTEPPIVVVDTDLPDMRGMTFLRALADGPPLTTRVLVLTTQQDGAAVYDALACGAAGYLAKAYTDESSLRRALEAVWQGRTVVSPELMRLIAMEIRLHAGQPTIQLTRREREVVRLVALGCSAPQIARMLCVSNSTVKTHLHSLYDKLGVSDRAAAVAKAMKAGLVQEV